MKYYEDLINNRPYDPKRDLFRKIKYGTYNIIELFEEDEMPWEEFSEEELDLIHKYETSYPEEKE